jgi:putative Mg2+ transporter-C (MgtC) family protein
MHPPTEELFALPPLAQFADASLRVLFAVILGGVVGAEREWVGKAAGIRTHMLVSLGSALFVMAAERAGLAEGDLGRIIQGVAAGIGFLGAGTILKLADQGEIRGLTTAAGIWLTAAVGIAVAVGPLWLPAICVIAAAAILFASPWLDRKNNPDRA